MIGGAFGLLNYCKIEDNFLTEDQILQRLDWFIYHGNNRTYDMINYEWLIFIEIKFHENEKILDKIHYLKKMIAKNYSLKEKMKARLVLQE